MSEDTILSLGFMAMIAALCVLRGIYHQRNHAHYKAMIWLRCAAAMVAVIGFTFAVIVYKSIFTVRL